MESVTDRHIPSIVYHYTTQDGLQGILENKTIRATNILYLNDSSEFSYSISLAKDVMGELISPIATSTSLSQVPKNIRLLVFIHDSLEKVDNYLSRPQALIRIFVCCFSTVPNELSQWREYCSHGNGFCIGFNTRQLGKQARKYGFGFRKCIYDLKRQRQMVESILDKVTMKYDAVNKPNQQGFSPSEDVTLNACVEMFLNELIMIAPKLKDRSFKGEKEVRLVLMEPNISKLELKYRARNSTMIPYVEFKLAEIGDPLLIPRLFIGPTVDMAKLFAEGFLQSLKAKGVICCSTVRSTIPYRSL